MQGHTQGWVVLPVWYFIIPTYPSFLINLEMNNSKSWEQPQKYNFSFLSSATSEDKFPNISPSHLDLDSHWLIPTFPFLPTPYWLKHFPNFWPTNITYPLLAARSDHEFGFSLIGWKLSGLFNWPHSLNKLLKMTKIFIKTCMGNIILQ